MVKKDLLEFILKVENKAVSSVNAKYDKLIKNEEAKAMKPYEDRIDKLQFTFNMFSQNLTMLLTDLKENKEIAYCGSHNIAQGQRYLSDIKTQIINNSSYQGQVQKLKDERNKELALVRANYKKVYVVSKNMSSAKKIAEYLEGLGFDISCVKEDEITALVSEIDKSKLFVCGENS